jgi:hypothetical protein
VRITSMSASRAARSSAGSGLTPGSHSCRMRRRGARAPSGDAADAGDGSDRRRRCALTRGGPPCVAARPPRPADGGGSQTAQRPEPRRPHGPGSLVSSAGLAPGQLFQRRDTEGRGHRVWWPPRR